MNQSNPEVTPSVLVFGATGTVGGAAASALAHGGVRVRALVRRPLTGALRDQVEAVVGDVRDPLCLKQAMQGIRAMLYVSPHEADEEQMCRAVVHACEALDVRLVFVGVHVDAGTRWQRAVLRALAQRILAHYGPKFRLAEQVRRSSARPVVLMPTNFFQNDELIRDDLQAGVFSAPLARPVNRVDVRDIADAVLRACTDPDLPSGAYPVVGPESFDAEGCARVWSRASGSEVRWDEDSTERFQRALERRLAGKKLEDFRASYEAIRKVSLPTSPRDVERTTWLLGHPPRTYGSYVEEQVRAWRVGPSSGPPMHAAVP